MTRYKPAQRRLAVRLMGTDFVIHNKVAFTVGVFWAFLTVFSNMVYRPLIQNFKVNDFGLVDVFPSIAGTVSLAFLSWAISIGSPIQILKNVIASVIGCMLYEIIQPYIGTGHFDSMDLLAVFISGLLSGLVIWLVLVNQREIA